MDLERLRSISTLVAALASAAACAACVEQLPLLPEPSTCVPPGQDGNRPASGDARLDLFPFALGACWDYAVADAHSGAPLDPKSNVLDKAGPLPASGDLHCEKKDLVGLASTRTDGSGTAEKWITRDDEGVWWQEDTFLDTSGTFVSQRLLCDKKLRVPERRTQTYDSWTDEYSEVTVDSDGASTVVHFTDAWLVVAGDGDEELVTVPAGTFRTIHFRKSVDGGAEGGVHMRDFWFARGVGKIMEVDHDNQEERLTSFFIPAEG